MQESPFYRKAQKSPHFSRVFRNPTRIPTKSKARARAGGSHGTPSISLTSALLDTTTRFTPRVRTVDQCPRATPPPSQTIYKALRPLASFDSRWFREADKTKSWAFMAIASKSRLPRRQKMAEPTKPCANFSRISSASLFDQSPSSPARPTQRRPQRSRASAPMTRRSDCWLEIRLCPALVHSIDTARSSTCCLRHFAAPSVSFS